jgi:hypothetical protein
MVKDETLVTCTAVGALAAVAIACAVTGHDDGLLTSVIAALGSLAGVGIGRATK